MVQLDTFFGLISYTFILFMLIRLIFLRKDNFENVLYILPTGLSGRKNFCALPKGFLFVCFPSKKRLSSSQDICRYILLLPTCEAVEEEEEKKSIQEKTRDT